VVSDQLERCDCGPDFSGDSARMGGVKAVLRNVDGEAGETLSQNLPADLPVWHFLVGGGELSW